MKHLPNIITALRIVGSIGLLFCNVAGCQFWTLYVLCGISDMIDETPGRKQNRVGSGQHCRFVIRGLLCHPIAAYNVDSFMAMDLGRNHRHHQDYQSDIILDHHQKILLPSY